MLVFLVILSFILCYGYALISIKRGYIVMRMPEGASIHYDKVTSRRGYIVSLGLFFTIPIFNFMMYIMDSVK